MIASIGGNTCPILAFNGFAKSPGPSTFLHMDGGTINGRYGYQKGQRSWLIYYHHKTGKILLLPAILAQFCRLVASLKALALPLLLMM
jgi:hypothetical protein